MILASLSVYIMIIRAPRIRGDDPVTLAVLVWSPECSPHPRG